MSNTFKNARNFTAFDVDRFNRQHAFQLLKVEGGYNYVDGKREEKPSHLKALVMVVADYTDENKRGDGVNRWAQFSVKLPAVSFNDTNVAELSKLLGKQVELVDAEIKVYGDYQNMLSIKAASLQVVNHGQAKGNQ